jgi:hypothetical protein
MCRVAFVSRAIVTLCALLVLAFVSDAIAAPAGATVFGYGAIFDNDAGISNFVSFAPVVTIAPLDIDLRAATFIGDDYSTEYAVDGDSNFVAIDTASGAVTTIGPLGVAATARASLGVDPTSGQMYGIFGDINCVGTNLYAIDATSGAAMLLAPLPECVQSVAYDPAGLLYILDLGATQLNVVDLLGNETTLGPLGIAMNGSARIVVDPASGALFLIEFEFGSFTNDLFAIDEASGAATFVETIGGQNPLAAPVLAMPPANDDTIFADGFDPPARD